MSVTLLVLPDFLLVALGWLLRNKLGGAKGPFNSEFFAGLERLVYFVLFPALLFQSILRTPLTAGAALSLIQAVLGLLFMAYLLAWLAKPVLKLDALAHASAAQCGYRFNTYIGLALASSMGGAHGQTIMAVLVGIGVPLANLMAVHGLARHSGARLGREIVRNPLVVSTIAGLVCNFAGVHLPGPIDTVLARLGAAAIALGIVCVGANLSWQGGNGHARLISWMLAVKLVAFPAMAVALIHVMDLPPLEARMLLLFAALPTASTTYVLAMRMGGDGRMVAVLVSLGTLLSAVTIPLWLTLAD